MQRVAVSHIATYSGYDGGLVDKSTSLHEVVNLVVSTLRVRRDVLSGLVANGAVLMVVVELHMGLLLSVLPV